MEFAWDAAKELANIQKHGVAFGEAVETFFDPKGFQLADKKTFRARTPVLLDREIKPGQGSNDMVY